MVDNMANLGKKLYASVITAKVDEFKDENKAGKLGKNMWISYQYKCR